MKNLMSLILVLGFSLASNAGDDKGHQHSKKGAKKHAHNHAHEHGAGELKIAFDQMNGTIEFKAAAEGVLGFEYVAKTAEDKEKLNQAVDYFKNQAAKILAFDAALGCALTNERAEQVSTKKNHSDFLVSYSVKCNQTVSKSKLTIDFSKFPGLTDVDAEILVGTKALPAEYKGKSITVDLP